ncbi:sulfatase-like hydrolase/transferase [Natronomonas sp. EA1]|uniref:sulfatase-like hydrolase/transferase n=1 Tax=Natronomonas sp. EA1 TaxID=3421655 RepID=UPI003EBEA64E
MQPNVLLVVLDTARARNLSLYGHANRTTPFLDSFADEATVFEQARAPASRSLDSHVSILTGLGVEEHAVTKSGRKLAPGNTVFEWLADQGYRTGVFSENNWLTDVDAGIKDAFQHVQGPRNVPFPEAMDPTSFVVEHGQGQYAEFVKAALASDAPAKALWNGVHTKLASDYPNLVPTRTSTPGGVYLDSLLGWLDSGEGPWAACLNLMDCHHPYEPEPEYDEWGGKRARSLQHDIEDVKWAFNGGRRPWWQRKALEGLYDGTIRQLDSILERLVSELKSRGEYDDTLVVVTSDHGEGFGEPSELRPNTRVASHSDGFHEVLLHVPLVVKAPGQDEGKRVSEVAAVAGFPDAVDCVLDGKDPAEGFQRDRVLVSVPGLDDPVQERASAYVDDLSPFTGFARVVYENADIGVTKHVVWEWAEGTETATFHVPDAHNAYRIEDEADAVVSDAFAPIEDVEVRAEGRRVEEMSEESRQRLEDLGYV